MTKIYSLPLPSSSDMNQAAHPGGGTRVTDASVEGVVEDLFEAHLRHLDIATKSAVANKLASLADRLDSDGVAFGVLDKFLFAIAVSESAVRIQKAADTLKSYSSKTRIVGDADVGERVVSLDSNKTNSNISEVIELRKQIDRTLDDISKSLPSENYAKIQNSARTLLALIGAQKDKAYLNNVLATRAIFGYTDESDDFIKILNTIADEADTASRVRQGQEGAQQPLNRVQNPGTSEAATAFQSRLLDMYETFDSIDRATEEWGEDLGPDAMKKLSAELAQAVPNIGALNHLDIIKKRVDAGQYNAKDIPRYEARLKVLEPILMAAKSKVEEIDARIISSTGGE